LTLALVLPDPAAAVIVLPISQPTWAELTSQQREILMPLSGEWDQLESFRRKKWLGIAQRYPSLPPDEQNRVQQRIKAWVNLSPSERQRARDLYKSLRKAAPEERAAVVQKWQEYKELPDTEKERLRKKAPAGKSAKNPVAGNAINSQPQRSNIPPGGHPAPITPLPAATSIDAPTVKPATAHSAPQRP
jgi:hypothetical protein